jgi:hypothetical protein
MLIIYELSIGAFLLTTLYLIYLVIPLHVIYFLHLLSTNHKCTQPCYFPLLLNPAAQKEMMDWNSSMMSSRLRVAPGCPFPWCDGVFHCSVPLRVNLVNKDNICVIIILYIMTKAWAQPSRYLAARPQLLGRPARVWRLFEIHLQHMST